MTSIHSQLPTRSLPEYSTTRSRHETAPTGTAQHVQGNSAAPLTAKMHDEMYVEMYNALQQLKPLPTLDAIRAQVPDDAWNAKQGQPSYGLDELLQTPLAKEMGLKLREEFGDFFPGKSERSWAGTALTVLLTKGVHGDPGEIAGFDFDSRGQTPSDTKATNMFSRLKQHLVDTGRTTPELADAAAYVLLWQSAPEYLLKDIPAGVDRFSLVWDQVRRKVSELSEVDDQAPLSKSYDDVLDILDPQRVADRKNQFI